MGREQAMCRMLADKICDMLKFEKDVSENYVDGKLPILDPRYGSKKTKTR